MKPLASLLFVAVISLGVSSQCPPHWTLFRGNCYRYGDKVINWLEAQVMCLTRGAKLAEISSPQVNGFLRSMAREKHPYCVWFGGDDIFQKLTWEWANASHIFNGYTNWADGQPDNHGGAQDCLEMLEEYNYAWDDESCHIGCNFICSRPASNPCVECLSKPTHEQEIQRLLE